ncbi:hypothetical protein KIPB_015392, partial [Kipferlia bialata]|eukprot:g15392.t1
MASRSRTGEGSQVSGSQHSHARHHRQRHSKQGQEALVKALERVADSDN